MKTKQAKEALFVAIVNTLLMALLTAVFLGAVLAAMWAIARYG